MLDGPVGRTLLVLLAVTLFGAFATWQAWDRLIELDLADTDDQMRLVQVVDLADGQAWDDLTQQRLDPPGGVPMHWTRHVDSIALPLVAAGGGDRGGVAAAIIVPLVQLAALLWILLLGYGSLGAGGDRWVLTLSVLASVVVVTNFTPGRLDHHGLQIVLSVGAAFALLSARPGVAGVLLGSSLAIGLDALIPVAGLLIALGVGWIADPDGHERTVRRFGPALVLAAGLGTLVFAGDGRLWSMACDVLALPWLVPLGVATAGLLAATALRPRSPLARGGTMALAGVASVLAVAMVRPACLAGPYADVPADVAERWLDAVNEALPLGVVLASRPLFGGAIMLTVLVGGLLTVVAMRGDWRRWLPATGLFAGAALVVPFQVRGFVMATALALPALIVVQSWVRSRSWPGASAGAAAALVAGILISNGTAAFVLADALESSSPAAVADGAAQTESCGARSSLAGLAEEPPALLLAPVDLGPAVLLHTDHEVLGAPYHRNADGIRATFDLFAADSVDDLRAAEVTLVAVCDDLGSNTLYATPGSLMSALIDEEVPPGLQPIPKSGPVSAYRVIP